MTRLQKKCLIAVAGTHLLAVVVLLCSGFIRPSPKQDNSQVLDMIPAKLIDDAFSSGVRSAQPPPVPFTPPVQPQTQPQPDPPKPVQPVKTVEPVKPPRVQPEDLKPVEPTEPKAKQQPKVQPNLKPVVRRPNEPDNSAAEAAKAEKEAKRLRDQRAKAFAAAASAIKNNSSSSTKIDMPGGSSVAYANYADVVRTVYTQAWMVPDDAANDEANVKVSITIANDGRVMDAHIVEKSGDSKLDRSVQSTLDRVTQLEPFPDGASEKERTYIINFNLKAKRMLG